MDPLSVISLVEACAGLAVTAGKLAIGLKSLADNYRSAALMFRSLSNQCKLFATAVRSIQAWMEDGPCTSSIDDRIWEQLAASLECANDAIYALENELVSTSKGTVNTFWDKVNVVWNVAGLKELQDCIHKQITSLSVILQIMNLPTRQSQEAGLAEQSSVFQESRLSALSMRDGDTSTMKGGGDDRSTIRAPSTIMIVLSQMPHFDFEEILLTSQVYLRNRNRTLALHATATKVKEEQSRLRELELQLQDRVKAHQDDKSELERRIKEADGVYREKLEQLENDYQSAVHYVKGTEKMVKRMKEELTKYKERNKELESALEKYRSLPGSWPQATDNA